MGEILGRVCAESALLAAWEKVRDSAYADGDPGAGVAAFERGALRGLTALVDELGRGTWRPGSVTAVEIPKPDGGLRRLGISSVKDRIVERAVLVELDRVVDPVLSPWCVAYRRGMGVRDAVRALVAARDAGQLFVAPADVADCFDSIPRWPVLQRLRELVGDPELVGVVELLVNRSYAGRGAWLGPSWAVAGLGAYAPNALGNVPDGRPPCRCRRGRAGRWGRVLGWGCGGGW